MNKTEFKVLAMATVMLLLGNGAYLNAQVTVGANTTPAATLDVVLDNPSNSTLAGVIAPRVERQYLIDKTYTSTQEGAIVYVNVLNGTPAGQAVNVTAIGYYYFDGAKWQPFVGGSSRLLVKHWAGLPYLISAADDNYLIVTTSPTTFTFPALTAEDAGVTVNIYNNAGTMNTYNGPINSAIAAHANGGIFIWTGSIWVALSKQ